MLFLLIAMLVNFQTKGSNADLNSISFILNEQQENNNSVVLVSENNNKTDDHKDIDVFYLMRLIQFLHKENNERKKENTLIMKILLPTHHGYENISNEIKRLVFENYNNFKLFNDLKNKIDDQQNNIDFLNKKINTLETEKENHATSPTAQKKRKNDFVIESPTKKRKKNNNNAKNN